MPKVKLPGKYRGVITDHCVDRNDHNGTYQLICSCQLITMRVEGGKDFLPLSEPEYATAYKVLVTKAGEIAIANVESIEKTFGWNRIDGLKALAMMDLSGREFEFVVACKIGPDGNPTDELGVEWINRPGGLREPKPETVEEMENKWKALLGDKSPTSAPTTPADAAEQFPFPTMRQEY